jgi:X-X-X-Leu-X-X-Gly heptad repeat protein
MLGTTGGASEFRSGSKELADGVRPASDHSLVTSGRTIPPMSSMAGSV